jgi:hypothetical protein
MNTSWRQLSAAALKPANCVGMVQVVEEKKKS